MGHYPLNNKIIASYLSIGTLTRSEPLSRAYATFVHNQTTPRFTMDIMDFPLFPKLPAELRRCVWQVCIPARRTIEIDMPPDPDMLSDSSICCCSPGHATRRNAEIPPFTQACCEAREAALEEGGCLLLPPDQDLERVPNRRVNITFENPWFWPGRDIIHLNWDPRCLEWYDMHEMPFPFLMRCAEDAAGWSVMSRLLGSPPIDHDESRRLSPRARMRTSRIQAEVLDHLVSQDDCTVCLMTVIIYASSHAVQDSALFNGGANPIQLVPMSDSHTFTAMHRLWESSLDQEKRETRDEQTNHQFCILFDHEELTRRVANLQEEVRELWLYRKYAEQWVSDDV